MNFSFILPTLGNENLVRTFLDSLERTTKHKDKIEVFFAIDEGKTDIINVVRNRDYSFDIEFFERPQTEDFTNDYYNFLANKCNGDNIIAFNDDAWMRTQDWDEKLLRTIKEYGWSIYMLDIPDTARIKYQHNFPCFPMVSRRAMNTLGFLLNKDVPMYPADRATFQIYYQAGRVIPIRNVMIEHEHILESDQSKSKMMEIFRKSKPQTEVSLANYILKLSKTAASEVRRPSKLKRILNILQEK